MNAKDSGQANGGQKGKKPGNIAPARAHELTEPHLEHFSPGMQPLPSRRPRDSRTPSAHHGVIGKDQKRREYCHAAAPRKTSAAGTAHGFNRGTAAGSAERQFCHDQHDARRKGEENVGQDECSAAVGTCPIWGISIWLRGQSLNRQRPG